MQCVEHLIGRVSGRGQQARDGGPAASPDDDVDVADRPREQGTSWRRLEVYRHPTEQAEGEPALRGGVDQPPAFVDGIFEWRACANRDRFAQGGPSARREEEIDVAAILGE